MNRDSKESLRQNLRKTRDRFFENNEALHKALSAKVCSKLAEVLPEKSLCASYRARGSELNPETLATLRPDCRFAYPKVEGEKLTFWQTDAKSRFAPGTFGLSEPVPETCEQVQLTNCDFILVPALAFDRNGHRLGYGRGFYDRALTGVKSPKVGLAFKFQIQQDSLPHDSFDIAMDMVVSEDFIMQPLERTKQ